MNNQEAIAFFKEIAYSHKIKRNGVVNPVNAELITAAELAIKALEQSDIIPVIIKDGDYKFDGLLDNNRQLLYGQGYTVEYVKDVLGMSWREAGNDNDQI